MAQRELPPLGVTGAVVVGDDGSAEAATAVRWAAEEARRRGCELVVLRAWSIKTAPRPAQWQPGFVPSEDEFAEAVSLALADDLAGVLEAHGDLSIRGLPVHDSAESALVRASREAAVVVVGSHGRHLAKALLGSTSEHLVRHACGPVVVIPVRTT